MPVEPDGACDGTSAAGASTAGASVAGNSDVDASTPGPGEDALSAVTSAAAGAFSAGFSNTGDFLTGTDTRIGVAPVRDLGDLACAAKLSTAATGFAGSEGCRRNFDASEGADRGVVRAMGSNAENGADDFGVGEEVSLDLIAVDTSSFAESIFIGFGGRPVRLGFDFSS